jgi:hypothetical protein
MTAQHILRCLAACSACSVVCWLCACSGGNSSSSAGLQSAGRAGGPTTVTDVGLGTDGGSSGDGNASGTSGASGNSGASATAISNANGRYDGDWSGETSQGRALTFSIATDHLVRLNSTVHLSADECDVSSITMTFTSTQPIVDDAFVLETETAAWTRMIKARFRDASTVEGDFNVELKMLLPGLPCHPTAMGTWSATKL